MHNARGERHVGDRKVGIEVYSLLEEISSDLEIVTSPREVPHATVISFPGIQPFNGLVQSSLIDIGCPRSASPSKQEGQTFRQRLSTAARQASSGSTVNVTTLRRRHLSQTGVAMPKMQSGNANTDNQMSWLHLMDEPRQPGVDAPTPRQPSTYARPDAPGRTLVLGLVPELPMPTQGAHGARAVDHQVGRRCFK